MKLSKKIISLALALCIAFTLCIPCFAANNYTNWFAGDYMEMTQLGLLPASFSGYDLTKPITRYEMCELALLAFEKITKNAIDAPTQSYFSDTSNANVLKAYEHGIVAGYPDGTFKPNKLLTRQEFFQIIVNFCNAAAFRPSASGTDMSKFTDYYSVANWAKEAAQICYKCGYVYGTATANGSVLNPNSNTSRQEAMAMFLRCYKGLNEYYYGLVLSAKVQAGEEIVNVNPYNDTLYVNTDVLNVRSTWSSNGDLLGELTYGSAVQVTGKCTNGWYQIAFRGGAAYVMGNYLRNGSGAAEQVTITGGSGRAVEIANFAMSFVGYKYVYAGKSPDTGFDCSGLMYYCLNHFGISVNRVADDQMDQGTPVEKSNLQVGDLVFFGSGTYADHVGMYIGGNNFVHAANPNSGVRIDSLDQTYYLNKYIGARRIITG